MNSSTVGIDGLSLAVPRRFLDLEKLARARGIDPEKYTVGLGCRHMAIADPGEDSVALAATAARRLLETTGADPARIGMLVVGTETGVDHAKPVASHVQGLLGLPRGMRVYDAMHACFGGTAGVMAAAEWIASGAAGGRTALVICSDIARYGVRTAGEPTQGAGAVAMLIAAEPRLLALELGLNGSASTHVYDFWRPHGRREALVDGHYSIQCYLDALAGAYRSWRANAVRLGIVPSSNGHLTSEALERVIYHVPFPKMAKKAHAHLRLCDYEDAHGAPPAGEAEALEAKRSVSSFERQVAPSLDLCAATGNIYTGSLYLGLASLLNAQSSELAGRRIGLFSYGSGCCGEFFTGIVARNASRAIALARIGSAYLDREEIGVAEYERIMALPADAPPDGSQKEHYRFTGIEDGRRLYSTPLALSARSR